MLDYSETSENVYLAFNQNIGLKNKRFENLVHLTFKQLHLSPLFFMGIFWGFAESFTEVVTNMLSGFQKLLADLQRVIRKESGMNYKGKHVYDF